MCTEVPIQVLRRVERGVRQSISRPYVPNKIEIGSRIFRGRTVGNVSPLVSTDGIYDINIH